MDHHPEDVADRCRLCGQEILHGGTRVIEYQSFIKQVFDVSITSMSNAIAVS